MTSQRYKELFHHIGLNLTPEEVSQGWHWCDEYDGLLVGPGMHEADCCHCWGDDPRHQMLRDAIPDKN